MTLTSEPAAATEPFRLFHVRVLRTERLSPSFTRITFTGDDLDRFADNGFDQRIKLVLPLAGRGLVDLPVGPGWYAEWRQLPETRRNPVRTYTARAVRPGQHEVDLDMVLHGESGPASRFATHARPGDEAALLGPDARFSGRHGGVEFAPPTGHRGPVLLAADETALPAVAGILERLSADVSGEVVLEVAERSDRLTLEAPPGLTVTWSPRDGRAHGLALETAVRDAAERIGAAPSPAYTWLAGEAAVIRRLRRHLVGELGHDRRAVTFMGYWRLGHPEA
jgi:NADPH-dependent ferric siderophore reductase